MIIDVNQNWMDGLKQVTTAEDVVSRCHEAGIVQFEVEFVQRKWGAPIIVRLDGTDELPPAFDNPVEWAKALAGQLQVRIEDVFGTEVQGGNTVPHALMNEVASVKFWVENLPKAPMGAILEEGPVMAARLQEVIGAIKKAYGGAT